MDINRIQFLREILVSDMKGKSTPTMLFSYDSEDQRDPRYFGVPDDDMVQAHALYAEWGGRCPEGYQIGSSGRSPWAPQRMQFKSIWK
jgi:hypothetical protein